MDDIDGHASLKEDNKKEKKKKKKKKWKRNIDSRATTSHFSVILSLMHEYTEALLSCSQALGVVFGDGGERSEGPTGVSGRVTVVDTF